MKTLETIEYLKNGFYICEVEAYYNGCFNRDLSLTNGEDYYECHYKVFESLKKNGKLKSVVEYETLQPDSTITYHYLLTGEPNE